MLALDNVVMPTEVDKNGVKVVATIDEHLAPLVEALALKHPEWRFESHYCRRYYGSNPANAEFYMVVERVKVMEKYEELGLLGLDYIRTGKRFWVSNHRTEQMRERGSGMKTIHLNKAIKYVEKYFGRKNVDEKLDEAVKDSRSALHDATRNKWYEVNNTWRELDSYAMRFAIEQIEQFKECVPDSLHNKLDTMPTKVDEYNGVRDMEDRFVKGDGGLVIIDGSHYIVKLGNESPQIMASEELPDFVRRGVGMLKLVEERQAIANVGLRVRENTYVVVKPNNVSEGEV